MCHTTFSGSGQCVPPGAANQDTIRAEGQHADQVQAAAYAAVYEDSELLANRRSNSGQGTDGRRRVIELAATVVRHDDVVTRSRKQCNVDRPCWNNERMPT